MIYFFKDSKGNKTQTFATNLIIFWKKVISEGRAGELKLLYAHPFGQSILENGGE